MGDFVRFQNARFIIFERKIRFDKGELFYLDTLGEQGMLHQTTIDHKGLPGIQLPGTITRVERESVFIQFDFDHEARQCCL